MKLCSGTVEPPIRFRIFPNLGTVDPRKIEVMTITARKAHRFQLKAVVNKELERRS